MEKRLAVVEGRLQASRSLVAVSESESMGESERQSRLPELNLTSQSFTTNRKHSERKSRLTHSLVFHSVQISLIRLAANQHPHRYLEPCSFIDLSHHYIHSKRHSIFPREVHIDDLPITC
jgi:hypothetical protein